MADNPFRSFAEMRAEQEAELSQSQVPISRVPRIVKAELKPVVIPMTENGEPAASFTLNH